MSPGNSKNCVIKKKSKRAIIKTWFHGPEKQFIHDKSLLCLENNLDSASQTASCSVRSKGQSPPQIYDLKDSAKTFPDIQENEEPVKKDVNPSDNVKENVEKEDNLEDDDFDEEIERKKSRGLSRKRLGELRETFKINLERITHSHGKFSLRMNMPDDESDFGDSTNVTIKTTESEAKGTLSCYQSFRTNPKDLSILYDYAMNTSLGELQKTSNDSKKSTFQGSLFRKLVYQDLSNEDFLEKFRNSSNTVPIEKLDLFKNDSTSSLYSSIYDFGDYSDESDDDDNYSERNAMIQAISPAAVNISTLLENPENTKRSTKRLLSIDRAEGTKRQRFDTNKELFIDSLFKQKNANTEFLSAIGNTSHPIPSLENADVESSNNTNNSTEIDHFLIQPKNINPASDEEYSSVPSLVPEEKSTSTSRITSDSSQLYTIPTFRNDTKSLNIANIVSNLRNGSIDTTRLKCRNAGDGMNTVSYRDEHFYDSLPDKYFCDESIDESIDENENLTNDEVEDRETTFALSHPYDTVRSFHTGLEDLSVINNEGTSVRFNDHSKLFVYTPKRKNLVHSRNEHQLLDSEKNQSLKSILKTKDHISTEIENARAICCDSVNVKSFIQSLNDYEEKRLTDDKNNAISRENQISRYYSKETSSNRSVIVSVQSCGSDS
ncbi:similar to Saccharomyces cerevisiae YBR045C GIP1 Meiosis-specific regulatory subunit of the Glc7p protein phosphatase [Maudiozyma saulgeensis]|uniref:Similar to Saccharomyces cerevisiae YBR045C GIP1 Meiosis-specific regulatory subunit of the Glc7p protein phosphatase n=1 Tax=Maudiozyma saulgeensis TaxID=1789683 RepID=A0A1X7R851_9SACH|nr:similar to Saccharomyces cerevisiae YBR045C GIP1 Meiosis-specific regulatory subunit of the Glc7p protein phosphatase [Kazachstania saulgeensis]